MTTLFDPLKLGDLDLPNRIIMSPLTRSRSGVSRIPNALMAQYYAQRATAGLILTEATVVSAMGIGYADTPGIWSAEQVEGWKLTTRAVHEAGGRIFLQLWHVGRISDPSFLDGALPVAPSAIAAKGNVSLIVPPTPFVTPRALGLEEIPGIVEAFRRGAQNAQLAGFDGVEVHGANGYLLDQFLQDGSNVRTDQYGGAIENRARLLLEATDAAVSVWGPGRVGVHLAPRGDAHAMGDSDLPHTFDYVARRLGERKIAFLCAREYIAPDRIGPKLKAAFGGTYIANEKFDYESATRAVDAGEADAVAFGKLFIANPDLPRRFKSNGPFNELKVAQLYAGGAHGYSDYPSLPNAVQSPDLNSSQARVKARVSSGV
jgi:2,4-dienoyl-CoA reductase-like NADH-dependent reductase (Old Yellow Enzyme family)